MGGIFGGGIGSPIDIGVEPVNNNWGNLGTRISLGNPANENGTITSVKVQLSANDTLHIGIFRLIAGTTYKCYAATSLAYTGAGAEEFHTVSLPVEAGDIIGEYCLTANYNNGALASGNTLYQAGNHCIVNDETEYLSSSTRALFISGTGSTPGGAPQKLTPRQNLW